MISNVEARTPEDCSPEQLGFLTSLRCQGEWKNRIDERQDRLSELQKDYQRLLSENTDLRRQVEVSTQIVAFLESELEPSRKRLAQLQALKSNISISRSEMNALIEEYTYLSQALNSLQKANVGCETVEVQTFKKTAGRKAAIYEQGGGLLVSVAQSYAIDRAFEYTAPKIYNSFLGRLYQLYSLVKTGVEVYTRARRVYNAWDSGGYVTESQTRCA